MALYEHFVTIETDDSHIVYRNSLKSLCGIKMPHVFGGTTEFSEDMLYYDMCDICRDKYIDRTVKLFSASLA